VSHLKITLKQIKAFFGACSKKYGHLTQNEIIIQKIKHFSKQLQTIFSWIRESQIQISRLKKARKQGNRIILLFWRAVRTDYGAKKAIYTALMHILK
jgi:hypothetical protein